MLSAFALILNQTVGYWLARKWLRQPIESWLRARGKSAPQIPEAEETLWILLLRVTPGVPLFVQNYLLGLAQVRFVRYLTISFPVQLAYAIAFVSLGHAFKDSNIWRGMLAVSGLAAVAVAVLLVRRHLDRKLRPPAQG
ncbi:MAG: VTT domain-containing protein [Verrucomicrobia bacterium]|nr:VTT domain-containing protein [Verrucomicrobiota bacterium]